MIPTSQLAIAFYYLAFLSAATSKSNLQTKKIENNASFLTECPFFKSVTPPKKLHDLKPYSDAFDMRMNLQKGIEELFKFSNSDPELISTENIEKLLSEVLISHMVSSNYYKVSSKVTIKYKNITGFYKTCKDLRMFEALSEKHANIKRSFVFFNFVIDTIMKQLSVSQDSSILFLKTIDKFFELLEDLGENAFKEVPNVKKVLEDCSVNMKIILSNIQKTLVDLNNKSTESKVDWAKDIDGFFSQILTSTSANELVRMTNELEAIFLKSLETIVDNANLHNGTDLSLDVMSYVMHYITLHSFFEFLLEMRNYKGYSILKLFSFTHDFAGAISRLALNLYMQFIDLKGEKYHIYTQIEETWDYNFLKVWKEEGISNIFPITDLTYLGSSNAMNRIQSRITELCNDVKSYLYNNKKVVSNAKDLLDNFLNKKDRIALEIEKLFEENDKPVLHRSLSKVSDLISDFEDAYSVGKDKNNIKKKSSSANISGKKEAVKVPTSAAKKGATQPVSTSEKNPIPSPAKADATQPVSTSKGVSPLTQTEANKPILPQGQSNKDLILEQNNHGNPKKTLIEPVKESSTSKQGLQDSSSEGVEGNGINGTKGKPDLKSSPVSSPESAEPIANQLVETIKDQNRLIVALAENVSPSPDHISNDQVVEIIENETEIIKKVGSNFSFLGYLC